MGKAKIDELKQKLVVAICSLVPCHCLEWGTNHWEGLRQLTRVSMFQTRLFEVQSGLDETKIFTAVAIAQLAEAGEAYVQRFNQQTPTRLPTVGDKVTIHHLLTHTSGMGDFFNEKFFFSSKDQFKTVEAFHPLFQDDYHFEPGPVAIQQLCYSRCHYWASGGAKLFRLCESTSTNQRSCLTLTLSWTNPSLI